MNKVILMGRLTRDPEVRYTDGAQPLCIARYTLAVNRRRRQDEEQKADFISCVAFGRLGEHAEKYYQQGLKVLVTGRIQTGSYTNRDGQKVYTTEVVVEESEFAESKSNSGTGPRDTPRGAAPAPGTAAIPEADPDGFMMVPDGVEDEGLPFN